MNKPCPAAFSRIFNFFNAGKNTKNYLFLLIILIMAWFQLFYRLDYLPVRVWDEGKNAVSAWEMLHNHDYLVRYYQGKPDNWGFKPPLLTWHQIIFMKLLGVNELAVRLPSALYALFTALLLYFFGLRELRSPRTGFIAAVVLLGSQGYLDRHIARTGDHDAMLVFFLVLQALSFFMYLKGDSRRNRYLLLFTAALILATYTKGIAAFFFMPGFLVYALVEKKLLSVLKHRMIYVVLLAFLLIAGGYYLYREIRDPGYLSAVWENELVPRYTDTADNYTYEHQNDYFYYIRQFWEKRFVPWIYLLPLFLPALFFQKDKKYRSLYFFLLSVSLTFLLIISMGTKNIWYDAPLFPLMALIIALGFHQIRGVLSELNWKEGLQKGLLFAGFVVLAYFAMDNTRNYTFAIEEKPWAYEEEGINYYLRERIRQNDWPAELELSYNSYNSHIIFYKNILEEKGCTVNFLDYRKLKPGMKIIACQGPVMSYIEANYNSLIEDLGKGTKCYTILESAGQDLPRTWKSNTEDCRIKSGT